MEDKIYSVLEKYGIDEPKASAITEDLLVLCAVSGCTCKIPEPRMKNSENGISAYCVKCTKQYYR